MRGIDSQYIRVATGTFDDVTYPELAHALALINVEMTFDRRGLLLRRKKTQPPEPPRDYVVVPLRVGSPDYTESENNV